MSAKDVVRVYASSLVEIGREKNILADIEEEMNILADLLSEERDLHLFLVAPGITKDKKKEFVEKVFSGRLSQYLVNFLKVLIDNDRQALIPEIKQAVTDLIDDINNRQRVTVIAAFPIDASMKERIASRLKEVIRKDVIIQEQINPEILGGIIIKAGDTVIDGSLVKDLKKIRRTLLQSKVRSEAAYED